jgi:hypothetical protein
VSSLHSLLENTIDLAARFAIRSMQLGGSKKFDGGSEWLLVHVPKSAFLKLQ